MDKNRLIQIANHFDKIGAYTISDEFENKFIRTAAPADEKLIPRNPSIDRRSATTNTSNVLDFFKNFATRVFNLQARTPADKLAFNLDSYNLILTWQRVFSIMKQNPVYSDPKLKKIVDDMFLELSLAEDNFKKAMPAGLTSAQVNQRTRDEIIKFINDEQTMLQIFRQFVDQENEKYKGGQNSAYYPYLNNLRIAETLLYNLDMTKTGNATLPLPFAPAAATPAGSAPAAAGAGGGAGGGAPAGGGRTQGSGGSAAGGSGTASGTAPAGGGAGGSQTQNKPTGSSAKKLSLSEINNELSKIVFRKIKSYYKDYDDKKLYQDMTEKNKLKAYLLFIKDDGLKGSVEQAIKAKYDGGNRKALLDKLEAKIAKSFQYTVPATNTQNGTKPSEQVPAPEAAGSGITSILTPDERVKQEAKKLNTFNFTCSREGLDFELKRMEKLFKEDPDKFMNNFLSDIERFIDCHRVLRNSLDLKDNNYFDLFANDLERKYFAYTFRKDLPY